MKISHTKVELYNTCPAKYKYKYVDGLEADKTFSALLFGKAIDRALNYVLLRTKHGHTPYPETAKDLFFKTMDQWHGQNEFVYFKNEMPKGDLDHLSSEDKQQQVWSHLCGVGSLMLDTYVDKILTQFDEILSVQTKREMPNQEGDVLVLITDFTARLKDGRVVIFDNKTSSDIKKNYGKNSVKKSQQLAIYSEFEENNLAGYIALSKVPKDGKIDYTIVVDEIEEEATAAAFERIDKALHGIKAEQFDKNLKACFSYGRSCEYAGICKKNSMDGLIERKRKS